MKIALGQINTTIGDIDGNVDKMIAFAINAKQGGARLVIFPELAVCGYPPMDLLLKDSFIAANLAGLDRLRQSVTGIAVLAGFVDTNPGDGRPLFNACAFIDGGEIVSRQYKTLLPSYDVFDEDRYFEPAHEYTPITIDGISIGLSICEDIWNAKQINTKPRYLIDPIERMIEHHPRLLINISASPFSIGKEHIRHDLVRNQARKHKVPVIYVNQVGGNDELIFDGRSIVVNADGELVARGNEFAEDLIYVDFDPSEDGTLHGHDGVVRNSSDDRTVNSYKAVVLGTKDYVRKCGFSKTVIGLSGGIDSAVTAAVAVKALGKENVVGIAMPSPYSSQGSLDDAEALAKNLGMEYRVVPIEPAMIAYNDMLAPIFEGTNRDVAEENIQARIRGGILMAISNKFNYLVLTTGNKSELAVGYCTLYGDMCGGLAVISDLLKTLVYDLAKYINEEAGREIIPRSTMEKPPSAELRPNQTDQDSLPPYVVLDGVLQAYVEQRRKPDEIVRLGYKPEVIMDVINKTDRSEYKRNQAAPGLKVTTRAFGFGWRMPIAQRFKETVGQETYQVVSK
ncbi:MAG TPA: NAD+ synthase [Drouetiella sp.]|jgi:NAD+ synthase (glutamine-hydrolysing)